MSWSLSDIEGIVSGAQLHNFDPSRRFHRFRPAFDATPDDIVWVGTERKNSQEILDGTAANIIVAHHSLVCKNVMHKTLIICENPKIMYINIINRCLTLSERSGISCKAIVSEDAKIAEGVYVGDFSSIGRCQIGRNSQIFPNVVIYDNVTIGDNVEIHSGAVIGTPGYGYSRDESGEMVHFPHVGGVVIEDDVMIGANTVVDRGSLGDTIIGRGSQIDNLVHVAHNVCIGKHCAIVASVMLGGSVILGDYVWISPNSSIIPAVTIGDHAYIGIGSVVTKDVPRGETWAGSPALELSEFKQHRAIMRHLLLAQNQSNGAL